MLSNAYVFSIITSKSSCSGSKTPEAKIGVALPQNGRTLSGGGSTLSQYQPRDNIQCLEMKKKTKLTYFLPQGALTDIYDIPLGSVQYKTVASRHQVFHYVYLLRTANNTHAYSGVPYQIVSNVDKAYYTSTSV